MAIQCCTVTDVCITPKLEELVMCLGSSMHVEQRDWSKLFDYFSVQSQGPSALAQTVLSQGVVLLEFNICIMVMC